MSNSQLSKGLWNASAVLVAAAAGLMVVSLLLDFMQPEPKLAVLEFKPLVDVEALRAHVEKTKAQTLVSDDSAEVPAL